MSASLISDYHIVDASSSPAPDGCGQTTCSNVAHATRPCCYWGWRQSRKSKNTKAAGEFYNGAYAEKYALDGRCHFG